MSLILNIDTAVQSASICLADDENILATAVNPSEKESASWLHVAISNLLQTQNVERHRLEAIAISAGPGSYTGLRVGMGAAKGLCYALSIPLISINTLQMMAAAVTAELDAIRCPMIDARRMEVFTALYDSELQEVLPPTNLILDDASFQDWLSQHRLLFFGNGSSKATTLIHHANATFIAITATATNMVPLSAAKFRSAEFTDLAYSEPFYGKAFHSVNMKKFY